jgi:hypothetical protein
MFTLLDVFMPQMYVIRIELLFITVTDHTKFTDVYTNHVAVSITVIYNHMLHINSTAFCPEHSGKLINVFVG